MRYHLWEEKVVNTTLIPSVMGKQGLVVILCYHYYFHSYFTKSYPTSSVTMSHVSQSTNVMETFSVPIHHIVQIMSGLDWAIIKFTNGNGKYCYHPSEILFFLKDEHESSPYNKLMAIVQTAETYDKTYPTDEQYLIVDRLVMNKHYYLIDADCIEDTCYVVPDVKCTDNEEDRSVLYVNPMNTWGETFINLAF